MTIQPQRRRLLIVASVVLSFCALLAFVITLWSRHAITYQMALLSFIALFGLYCGFGALIAIYRFVGKLD
jgi:hypothetical protein